MANASIRKGYAVSRWASNGGYSHLQIALVDLNSETNLYRPHATITWQGDPTNTGWYAGKLKVEAESQEGLALGAKLLRSIGEIGWNLQPDEVVKRLRRARFVPAVYDARHSTYRAVSELEPGNRYVDNCRVTGYQYCTVSVVCGSAEAVEAIDAAFKQEVAEHPSYTERADRYDRWLACGKPITLADECPDVPDEKKLFAL